MTTIVWDGRTLAADSRVTSNVYIDTFRKLFTFDEPFVVGEDELRAIAFSGSVGYIPQFIEYLCSGSLPDVPKDTDDIITAIAVGKFGVYEFESLSKRYLVYPLSTKLARGTGSVFAYSAMHLGLFAVDAVKHAMHFDVCTGGEVLSYTKRE